MKKLLATDLDGTLLKDDKTISNYTINKVHEMINEGHYFEENKRNKVRKSPNSN